MYRWLAYTGNPIQLEAVRFRAQHSPGDNAYPVLPEPLIDLPSAWKEIPESAAIVARGTSMERHSFNPALP